MYQLKITTVGSSSGVILPKHVLEKLRVGKGDVLCLTETPDGFKITPYQKDFAEAMDVAEEIMRENRDALRALAK
jgi:putative addiction module antidote